MQPSSIRFRYLLLASLSAFGFQPLMGCTVSDAEGSGGAGGAPLNGGGPNGGGGAATGDCTPVTDEPIILIEQGSIAQANAESLHTITQPVMVGEGILEAVLSFDAYPGQPRLDLWGNDGSTVIATGISLSPDDPDYSPEAKLTWEMTAQQVADLRVTEFLPSTEPNDYPVDYTLSLTWTRTPDCWEENDTAADAAQIPAGQTQEAWLSGAISSNTLRDVDEDWYVVDLPEDATAVNATLAFPADGIIPMIELFSDEGATSLGSASAFYPDGIPLVLEAAVSGKVWVKVTDRFGVEIGYGEPFDPSGTPRPSHFDSPYELTVTPQ